MDRCLRHDGRRVRRLSTSATVRRFAQESRPHRRCADLFRGPCEAPPNNESTALAGDERNLSTQWLERCSAAVVSRAETPPTPDRTADNRNNRKHPAPRALQRGRAQEQERDQQVVSLLPAPVR